MDLYLGIALIIFVAFAMFLIIYGLFKKARKISKEKDQKKEELKSEIQEEPVMKIKKIDQKYNSVVGETLKVQDVLSFFKYNINPSNIEAKIEKAIAIGLKKQRGIPVVAIGILVFILIGGAIAYVIVSGQMTESACCQKLASMIEPTAKVVTQQTPAPSVVSTGSAATTIG